MNLINITPNDETWFNLKNLPSEEWKDIQGYEGLYQVSNYGRIKSLSKYKNRKIFIMKPYKDKYSSVNTPIAKRTSDNVLTIPMYANLSLDDVDRICDTILKK